MYRKDIATGGILFIFAAVYFSLAFKIKTFRGLGVTPLSAQFVPKLWGVFLMILSALVLIRGIKEYRAAKAAGQTEKSGKTWAEFWHDNYAVILTFVLLGIYILLLKPVGFIVMSAIYMFAAMMVLSNPKKRTYALPAIVSVVCAVGLDYIFVVLLKVLLPTGIIGF